jgi:hypothetical protein
MIKVKVLGNLSVINGEYVASTLIMKTAGFCEILIPQVLTVVTAE